MRWGRRATSGEYLFFCGEGQPRAMVNPHIALGFIFCNGLATALRVEPEVVTSSTMMRFLGWGG